jgi:DNA-binding transcriptional LysR family regulator
MTDLQVEYFLAVAAHLNFTKAAEALFVSQPAVSKQISLMEKELGVALFSREGKSTRLTDAGRLYESYYLEQRTRLGEVARQAAAVASGKNQPLRIAFGSGWSLKEFLPDALKRTAARVPGLEPQIRCHNFEMLTFLLAEDKVDAIITLSVDLRENDAVETRALCKVPVVVAYSSNTASAQGKARPSPKDFKDETFFVLKSNESYHILNMSKGFLEPYGFVPKWRHVHNVNSVFANVVAGLGVAIVDEWLYDSFQSGLKRIPLGAAYTVTAAWKRKNENPALKAFLEELHF